MMILKYKKKYQKVKKDISDVYRNCKYPQINQYFKSEDSAKDQYLQDKDPFRSENFDIANDFKTMVQALCFY